MDNLSQTFSYRRSNRLRDYDYRQAGAYFVTICTHGNAKPFGGVDHGKMKLNNLGHIVAEEWLHIANARPNIQLDHFVVMPNHVHGIIFIVESCIDDSDNRATGSESEASKTLLSGSLGAIVGHLKAAVSRRAKREKILFQEKIWQRSFYEHIIRKEKSLNEIRRYIIDNPGRWHDDSLYIE